MLTLRAQRFFVDTQVTSTEKKKKSLATTEWLANEAVFALYLAVDCLHFSGGRECYLFLWIMYVQWRRALLDAEIKKKKKDWEHCDQLGLSRDARWAGPSVAS